MCPTETAFPKSVLQGNSWQFNGWTQHFHCRGSHSIPGQGTKIPQTVYRGHAKKKKKKKSTLLTKKEKNAVPDFWEKQAGWAGRRGLGYLGTIRGSDWCPAHKPDLSGLSRLEKTELGNSGGTIFPPLHWWQQELNVMRGRVVALVSFVNKWVEQ